MLVEEFEERFRDPATGLMFSMLDKATGRPATDGFFAEAEEEPQETTVDGVPLADQFSHENSGMTTGAYMLAEVLRNELGWRPEENFDTGIRRTVQWYLDNAWWWQPIREKKYAGQRLGKA